MFFENGVSVFLYFPLFLAAIFVAFYLPASVLLRDKISFPNAFAKLTIYLIVGMVLWAYQGMVFGYIHMRFLAYVYLILFFFLWIRRQKTLSFPTIKIEKISLLLLPIFVIGIFGQTQQFLITGFQFTDGIHIFTAATDDLFYHSSLIAQVVRRLPPFEPGLAGVVLTNYHYWSNLITAELVRVFWFPLMPTQYIYSYLLLSFLLGSVAYTLGRVFNFSNLGILFLVYLQYFPSDVIYLLTLITNRVFEFGVHPLEDGTMFLENPPRAFSIVVALASTFLLFQTLKSKNIQLAFISALLFGSLIGFKVHMGIAATVGLAAFALYALVTGKLKMLIVPVGALLLSMLIYLLVNSKSGTLIFSPFEMARMFAVQEKLHLSNLELARWVYRDHGNILQGLRMDLTMLLAFILAQFGIKNFGWLFPKAFIRKTTIPFTLFLYSAVLGGIITGTVFIQPISHGDTFNFYLAGMLFLSIPAAFALSNIFQKGNTLAKFAIILILLASTMPRWIYKTKAVSNYAVKTSPAIHASELETMVFLKENTPKDAVVLVFNKGQWDSHFPYVNIFTQRDTFLSGQVILARHGVRYDHREEIVQRLLVSKDKNEVKELLVKNDIDILYFYGDPIVAEGLKQLPLEKIFQNNHNTVYRFGG